VEHLVPILYRGPIISVVNKIKLKAQIGSLVTRIDEESLKVSTLHSGEVVIYTDER